MMLEDNLKKNERFSPEPPGVVVRLSDHMVEHLEMSEAKIFRRLDIGPNRTSVTANFIARKDDADVH